MNKLNTIIDDSLRDAHIRPCPLRFVELRFNARYRAKASGMEHYYLVAERAFRKPETAKKTLQYLLTNLSAMICENVYIGHAISERNLNVPASRVGLQKIYESILVDRHIINTDAIIIPSGVETFRDSDNDRSREEKIANLYSWNKIIMRDANISGASDAFSLAGLFQYAVLWKPDRPHAHAGDPTAICSKLLCQYVYPIEEARQKDPTCHDSTSRSLDNSLENCRKLTEFVFKLRNDLVHHNFIPELHDIPLQSSFNAVIKRLYPAKYDSRQKELLVCIAMTIAMPYVVSCLLNGPRLAFNADWLVACPPLWARWKGNFPDYPMVDPLLGSQLASSTKSRPRYSGNKKSGRKRSAIGYSISYIFRKSLQVAFLIAIAVFIRALVHNWRGTGFNGYTASEEIHDYIGSMNNYDRALLLKERRKFLRKNPTLYNEQRENELSRRYSDEHWPETSFSRTVWHIGTPRWLHGGRDATPVAEASVADADLSGKYNTDSNSNLD